jgi:hypothetical protein
MPRKSRTSIRVLSYVPWFVSKEVYSRMYRLLPKICFRRFSTYFKRYGCLRCSRRLALYGANGLCLQCLGVVSERLKVCDGMLKRRYKDHSCKADRYFHRAKTAQAMLSDLAALHKPDGNDHQKRCAKRGMLEEQESRRKQP